MGKGRRGAPFARSAPADLELSVLQQDFLVENYHYNYNKCAKTAKTPTKNRWGFKR